MTFAVHYLGRHIFDSSAKAVRFAVERLFGESEIGQSYVAIL